ncbi:dimethylsulfonioproprionate lyase family protein [Tabrizicola sp.]|uniref:dimethylsulfonioproprionate lyase family protein n=1 Tax=Tabrizicola sp. TaxID=2005166 RepID=UPI0035AF20D2
MTRSPEISAFLAASAAALRKSCTGEALRAAETVIGRFDAVGPTGGNPARLPVCDWIAPALAAVAPERAALGRAFAAVQGQLEWKRRVSARESDQRFWNGHANAMILGPGGLERRDDLWIGVTVMAPGVDYATHNHPPEEVYLSLSPGEWWNARMDWTDPGPTGCIYNPPGIAHAMRSGEGPFLALWYLPI